jgi:hypothetical protein
MLYWLVNTSVLDKHFWDCIEPEDGGSKLVELLINIYETTWHYFLKDMKLLLLSCDSLIICFIQGTGVACYILLALFWMSGSSGSGMCVKSKCSVTQVNLLGWFGQQWSVYMLGTRLDSWLQQGCFCLPL